MTGGDLVATPFDAQSGSWLERMVFGHRLAIVFACVLATAFFGVQATRLRLNASFENTIPASHPYAVNFLTHQRDLTALGNAVRIAVEATRGSVYDAAYLATLRSISDDLFLLPGVDRPFMKSLWTPNTRWMAVTEEGLEGGPVMPERYDGSASALKELETNVGRSGEIGDIVAVDGKSSIVYVPLLSADAANHPLDYERLSRQLDDIRAKYETQGVRLHIVGFAKLVGDLIAGMAEVLAYFALAASVATVAIFFYTRCARATFLVVLVSLVAVIWQLGALRTLGRHLDAFSMLVPFLVFAIGVSHAAQKMNGIMQDSGRGADRYVAARRTFRRLFRAGLAALVADAAGFLVLFVIDIEAIRNLALAATLGVTALIATNLVLLPVLLSYTGVTPSAAERSLRAETDAGAMDLLGFFAGRTGARVAIIAAAVLAAGGALMASKLQFGDLDAGAPELRADSRYNRDLAFVNAAYHSGGDVFAVMVTTPDQACAGYDTLMRVDALEWELRQLPFVESTTSLASLNRRVLVGLSEGNPKWYELVANQAMLNTATGWAPRGLFNATCGLSTIRVYLKDHKADTLASLVDHMERFAAANDNGNARFLLAAGNSGIEAITNIAVTQAWRDMLLLVYGAVVLLVLIVFRSWRVVVIAVLPLLLTSVLVEALMVLLGVGVKVATLPVIVLGVGLGVDYAFYILAVMLALMKQGLPLPQAHRATMRFTGKVVLLTGTTLSAGVATWVLSDIKFQADMGILLAFMILLNMLGAMVLLPALSHYLLTTRHT